MNIQSVNLNTYRNNNYNQTQNFNGGLNKTVASVYDNFTDKLARGFGKIIDTDAVQKFSNKFHNTNLATHIFSATGILLSGFFIGSIARSKKIEEERKTPLMINEAISCTIATTGGYTIDNLLNKPIQKFSERFKNANIDNPNLHKYLDGIKIAKSALIFGMLYRFAVPVLSMFLAEKFIEKKQLNKTA